MIFKKVLIVFLMLCFFASCSSQNKMETEDIFIEKISREETEETKKEAKIQEGMLLDMLKCGTCNHSCPAAKRLYGAEAYP